MTINKIHSAYAALALAVLLSSACQREDMTQPQRESVSFTVRTDGASPTKAAIYPEGALQKGAELGLVAYAYAADNAPASAWKVLTKPAVTPLILDDSGSGGNRTDGSGKWIPAPGSRLLWPGEGFVRYFAYVPYSAVSGTFADNGAPVLNYSVPAGVDSQVDLLVSTPESTRQYSGDPGWRNIDVPMNLQHALTGVRFRVEEGLSVTSFKLLGVYSSGTLDLSAPSAWSGLSGIASYELTGLSLGSGLHKDIQHDGYNILDNDKILFLMPQTLPAGAKVQAVVVDGDSTKTFGRSIAGASWRPGQMITYTLRIKDRTLVAEGEEIVWDEDIYMNIL